ncbi:MAG TPA: hypothetical protein IAC31_07930 [Candidatus Faecousia intestinigallinarum]|nr:hypothetical protein [Candidatus Faecousia intestinigallinarum]
MKIVHRIYAFAAAAAIVVILGSGFLIASFLVQEKAYRACTDISEATDLNRRIESYKSAIRIAPHKPLAYCLILDAYGQDSIFSKEESEDFLSLYNAQSASLSRSRDCAMLHYQAGMLYINGYDETPTIRLRMAVPFFTTAQNLLPEDSVEYMISACYAFIGNYYREYVWTASIQEVPPDRMAELLEQIQITHTLFQADQSSAGLYNTLGFYTAICNLLYEQRNVLAATVDYQQVFDLLNSIYANLPEQLQTETMQSMVAALLEQKDLYYDMLERAYSREGGTANDT